VKSWSMPTPSEAGETKCISVVPTVSTRCAIRPGRALTSSWRPWMTSCAALSLTT
jgi:hypothetical protein